jgi:hypothetical protein
MGCLKRFSCIAAVFFAPALVLFFSCENVAGMGPIVDLEPPAISITSPARFSYVPGEFELRGESTDNVKVVKIVISDISTGEEYGNAEIDGNVWSFPMILSEDGEYGFKAAAYDAGGNSMADTVTLFVDLTPPSVSNVAIIRHKDLTPYTTLKPLEELKAYDPAVYEQMNYFQNESVRIRAQVNEDRRIKNALLKIYEYDESSGSLILRLEGLPSGSWNPMAPEWELTQDMLTATLPALAAGPHYFKPVVEVFDEAMNAEREDNSLGFFCWWSETDLPRLSVRKENGGAISVIQGDVI